MRDTPKPTTFFADDPRFGEVRVRVIADADDGEHRLHVAVELNDGRCFTSSSLKWCGNHRLGAWYEGRSRVDAPTLTATVEAGLNR